MKEKETGDIVFISLFPSIKIKKEEAEQILQLMEKLETGMPEEWGPNERVCLAYNRDEIIEEIEKDKRAGLKRISQLFLYHKQNLKYRCYFDIEEGQRSFFSFICEEVSTQNELIEIFNLGENIAEIIQPDFGVIQVFSEKEYSEEKSVGEKGITIDFLKSCGRPTPGRFYPYGPYGIGMRTYFGKKWIKKLGLDFFKEIPLIITEQKWGGIRVDIQNEYWNTEIQNWISYWEKGMDYLAKEELFAISKNGRVQPSKVWKEIVLIKEEKEIKKEAKKESDLYASDVLKLCEESIEKDNMLKHIDIEGKDISFAELYNLNACGLTALQSNWKGSILEDCYFEDCDFAEANFTGCILEKTWIKDCGFEEVNFKGAKLKQAVFLISRVQGANFQQADLREAELTDTSFREAYFYKADLRNVKAADINFQGADFTSANLSYGDFENSEFQGADLSYADLTSGNFKEADFRGAVLKDTVWKGANIEGALFDEGVKIDI